MVVSLLELVNRKSTHPARREPRPPDSLPPLMAHREGEAPAEPFSFRRGNKAPINPFRYLVLLLILLVFQIVSAQVQAQQEKRLYVFDVHAYFDANPDRPTSWRYDVLTLLASLQGLVNRPEPGGGVPDAMLYVLFIRDAVISAYHKEIDLYWLQYLRGPGRLLADYSVVEVPDLETLLGYPEIQKHSQKVVLWDERVPSTANVAATICGVENLLPIRYDTSSQSLFSQLVQSGPKITVGRSLVDAFLGYGSVPETRLPSSRSRKGDAYLWAKSQFLDSGLTDPAELAYYLDGFDWDQSQPGFQCPDLINACLLNHDFFISRKAFFFDLDPWWDEKATDETAMISPEEVRVLPDGVDEGVLKEILRSAEQRTRGLRKLIRIGGYVPWWLKYSNYGSVGGKHDAAATQEEFTSITSCFNAYLEPDAYGIGGVANASVFQHVRLEEPFEQNAVPAPKELERKTYLLFYMGDYDSASWLAQAVPSIWDDTSRGRLPLAWGINPTLSDRLPHVFNYLFRTRTYNDFFVGSRSGAGFINPGFLLKENRPHSDLSDGLDIWVKHNHFWYRKFDLQITGLVHNGQPGDSSAPTEISEPIQESFFHFSPHGVGCSGPFFKPLVGNLVPFIEHTALLSNRTTRVDDMIRTIIDHRPQEKPAFQIYRCVLTTPTNVFFLVEELQRRYPNEFEIIDPYTFFYLLRGKMGGANQSIALFCDHNIPQRMVKSQLFQCTVRLRNDGWDVWNPKGTPIKKSYRLCYKWRYDLPGGKTGEEPGRHNTYIEGPVETGQIIDVNLLIETPRYPNLYTLRLYLDREGIGPAINWEDLNVVVTD
ncbi:MAG: hypothetical protein ABIH23_36440 [bacterium]